MLKPGLITFVFAAYAILHPWHSFDPDFHIPPAASQSVLLSRGQLIDKVVCAADPTQSYALYLPSSYVPERQWPILYALDPGARGKVAIERFTEAAEKYGWIVVGSNNSRNGPMRPSADAWNAMWNDTHQRFAIDEHRVYATGLSGGARTAILFANLCGDCVTGVIACGAGFPEQVSPSPAMHFIFFGTVGLGDFNFPEMKDLDGALSKLGIEHQLRVFAGRHEWAPPAVATEAVEWMELQAMKAGKRQRDDKLVNDLWQKGFARAESAQTVNEPYEAYQILMGMKESFKGLHETAELEKLVTKLAAGRAVKDAIRQERQEASRQREIESQIYQMIAAAGSNEDVSGARARLPMTIADLKKSANVEGDSSERRVDRRVLEGLSVGLMEQGRELLQTKNKADAAARQFELVIEVNPDRASPYFYLACAYALSGEKKKSLQALQQAVDKGFTDIGAVTENRALDSLRKESRYQQLIQRMQGGKP